MSELFVGTEMLARGALTRGQLRWNYRSMLTGALSLIGALF